MIKQLFFFGDSLTEGSQLAVPSSNRIYDGGAGGWWELIAERFANIPEIGPLISTGIRPVSEGLVSSSQWSYSGSWTGITGSTNYDKWTYGELQYANGISNVATYTTSIYWREPVGYTIYYLDYDAGGNWQYRIDGGAWINMAQTLAHDNTLAKFYIASPGGSNPHTIDIRGYDGTADCGVMPCGLEVFFVDPTQPNLNGLIIHNVAVGGHLLAQMFANAPGDRFAVLDSVKLGTNAISNTPNMGCIVMHINDASVFQNVTNWGTHLSGFYNRCAPLGPVGFISPWEVGSDSNVNHWQQQYRAKTKLVASDNGANVLDLFDAWTALGFGDGTVGTQTPALQNEGYLSTADGGTHETALAHQDLAVRIFDWMKSSVWPLYNYVGPTVSHFNLGDSQLASANTMAGTPATITSGHGGIPIVGAQ
jgi:lysophospholipase L1-like esterase